LPKALPSTAPARDGRSLPIERYVVLNYPFADGVDIARILHTARDIEALL